MREAVRRFALARRAEEIQIVAGTLGERAELLGALRWPRQPIAMSPEAPSSGEVSRSRPRDSKSQ